MIFLIVDDYCYCMIIFFAERNDILKCQFVFVKLDLDYIQSQDLRVTGFSKAEDFSSNCIFGYDCGNIIRAYSLDTKAISPTLSVFDLILTSTNTAVKFISLVIVKTEIKVVII